MYIYNYINSNIFPVDLRESYHLKLFIILLSAAAACEVSRAKSPHRIPLLKSSVISEYQSGEWIDNQVSQRTN